MAEPSDAITNWLLEGDVAIQYQVHRDLLGTADGILTPLQRRIEIEGWGSHFLSLQKPDGHWGRGFYQPKWTCTHYTLLDLRNLAMPKDNLQARRAVQMVFDTSLDTDGSVDFARSNVPSDVCINGMALAYSSYFLSEEPRIQGIIDYLLRVHLPDGGWNCESMRRSVSHSSLHTTISVLEGLLEYRQTGSTYRLSEILQAEKEAQEFILRHKVYLSDRTGEVIKRQFLTLSYPSRWYYDILRALDYFRTAAIGYDERMAPALEVLAKKRLADGSWPLQSAHPGAVHFAMEEVGQPSRWNTLRALRVMRLYG